MNIIKKIIYILGIVLLFMYSILEFYICLNQKMDGDNIFKLITIIICFYSLYILINKLIMFSNCLHSIKTITYDNSLTDKKKNEYISNKIFDIEKDLK